MNNNTVAVAKIDILMSFLPNLSKLILLLSNSIYNLADYYKFK